MKWFDCGANDENLWQEVGCFDRWKEEDD